MRDAEVVPSNAETHHQTLEMAQNDRNKTTPNKSTGIEETPFIDGSQLVNKPVNLKKNHPPPTWKGNLSYYFSQYCSASSIHGVQYLGERGRYFAEKIVWAIIITIVWYLCIMLICKTYNKWVTSPVIVTFATTETPISSIPFPAITICPAVKSDPKIFNFTDVLLKKVLGKETTADENGKFEVFSLVCSGLDEYFSQDGFLAKRNLTVDEDLIDYLLEAFPSLDDKTEAHWLGKKIELGNLSLSVSSDGFCYSFNMLDYSELLKDPEEYVANRSAEGTKPQKWSLDGGYPDGAQLDAFPRRTFVSGINGGFQALLHTNHTHLDYLCGEMLQGFKVTLHHPCEGPNMDQHFQLPLDQAVLVAIKPRMIVISEELKSYQPEKRKCYLTNERPLALFKTYTQRNCLDECLSNYTLSNCKCVPFYMPKHDSSPICGSGNQDCEEESKVKYLSNHNSNCNCLPSCTSLQYDVEISQSNWNWRDMFEVLGHLNPNYRESFDDAKSHFSMLAVYYKEMQFLTSERHELYGYVDFFSNTGGLLGLFIGFSVTSAIEILYFLTLRLGCNVRRFGKVFWSGEPELINAEDAQQT